MQVMQAMLSVAVEKTLGAFHIDAQFETGPGLTALFGRSGSGKTSIINMIAGLLTPDKGRIGFGDQVLFDAKSRINIPPHKRRFGAVFQDGRLFPHLSVRQNLEYGRWMHRMRSDKTTFDHMVALLDLSHLLIRRPGGLSGGERQRVAIGRALLFAPRLLLLDEPFASLDEPRKAEILPYLERLRAEFGVPMIYVSHHIEEVRRIADTVVLIEAGRVTANGRPQTILASAS